MLGRAAERNAGFTLIEVLIAFAIAALTLGVVMQVYGSGVVRIGVARDHGQAVQVAQSVMAEVRRYDLKNLTTRRGQSGKFQWIRRVEAYQDQNRADKKFAMQLVAVEVVVRWGKNNSRSVRLWSLRL